MKYLKIFSVLLIVFLNIVPAGYAAGPENVPTEIGKSVEGRSIEVYSFGNGEKEIVLYGGIHGGYEWNTVALTERLIEFFSTNPDVIPEDIRLYIIPCLNPDGLAAVFGDEHGGAGLIPDKFDLGKVDTRPGRFNARGVDLNRNWDARWEPISEWRSEKVDAGSRPFSEPETSALRDFVLRIQPEVVVSYHSAANGIYFSGKHDLWEPARTLANSYSEASGYPIPQGRSLVGYRITGASGGYFYSKGIPEITVELAGRNGPEFERNIAGVKALFRHITSPD